MKQRVPLIGIELTPVQLRLTEH